MLVVLGTGFAAFSLLKNLKHGLFNVIVVSPRNHFLFTPLLPSTTVGTIEFRSIIEPIRVGAPYATYYQASCKTINPTEQIIVVQSAMDGRVYDIHYDVLVIGVGAKTNTFGIPGVNEHALFLKELSDARAIRQNIIERFEMAAQLDLDEEERKRLLHVVVVGGGPTGVEFAAEMHDFLSEDLSNIYPALHNYVAITLLEAGNNILTTFDKELSEYTMRLFKRQHIDIRTRSLVTRIGKTVIYLNDGTEIPYGVVVWSTGIGPQDFVVSSPLPLNDGKKIITDERLLVQGYNNIFAAGDCAAIEKNNLPATSQVAQQEGRFLAKQLYRYGKDMPLIPFQYHHYGMLAYVGGNKALADLNLFKGRGFTTWLFWRSAYLTKLVSWKNKILVIFDWLKAIVFGRDVSRF